MDLEKQLALFRNIVKDLHHSYIAMYLLEGRLEKYI